VTSRAPDLIEPSVGWRVWVVVEEQGELRLASVLYPTIWPVRRELVAACDARPDPDGTDRVPHVQCSCGVHAAVAVEDATSYFDGRGARTMREVYRVIGRVSLWGRVVEGDAGWRASHAYPKELYVPSRCLSAAGRTNAAQVALALTDYGVPVRLLSGMTKRGVYAELAEMPLAA
jgi:hypothetical protein